MKRKHENFSYDYGFRTAPEQWNFFCNEKKINLDSNTRTRLVCLCLAGKTKESEDELKRLLRKEEKELKCKYVTFAFWGKDSDDFFYTSDLLANPNDIMDRLRIYKEWKHYIFERNKGRLQPFVVEIGYFSPYGNEAAKKEDTSVEIDIHRCRTIRLVENKDNILFAV